MASTSNVVETTNELLVTGFDLVTILENFPLSSIKFFPSEHDHYQKSVFE